MNVEFYEEFISLEKICNEIYHDQHGVSLYIADMESESNRGSHAVTNWDRDLRRLNKLRHARNQMSHPSEIQEDVTEDDIGFLKEFHERILKGTDPIALLNHQQQLKESASRRTEISSKAYSDSQTDNLSEVLIRQSEQDKESEITKDSEITKAASEDSDADYVSATQIVSEVIIALLLVALLMGVAWILYSFVV